MKRDTVNYLVVGSFVLGMFVLLMLALFKVTGRDTSTTPYYVLYKKIPGIIEGSTVTYGGFQVGRVNGIEPAVQEGEISYRVELAIRRDWQIPKDSVATIVMPALLSDRQIDIQAGKSKEILPAGAMIATARKPDFMEAMQDVAAEISDLSENTIKPLINNIREPLTNVGETLGKTAPHIIENVDALIANLNRTAEKLSSLMNDENQAHVDKVFANADVITSGLAGMTNDFSDLKGKLDLLLTDSHALIAGNSGDISQSVSEMRNSLDLISQHLNTILYHLEGTSRNMHELSRSLRENPSLLIRGGSSEEEVAQ